MKPLMRAAAIVGLSVSATFQLVAQDVTVGPTLFGPGQQAPAAMPELKRPPKVSYPDSMKGVDQIGYALGQIVGNETTNKWYIQASATHVPFAQELTEAALHWELKPGPVAGAVQPLMYVPYIFNPRSASTRQTNATPRLLSVTAIPLPQSFVNGLKPPVVRVCVALDAGGSMTRLGLAQKADPRLLPILRAELAHWRFAPARANGQPVPAELELSVVLSGAPYSRYRFQNVPAEQAQQTTRDAFPVLRTFVVRPPEVPAEPAPSVVAEYTVDGDGVVQNATIAESSDPRLNEPALAALRTWLFAPALKDGVPVEQRRKLNVDILADAKPPARKVQTTAPVAVSRPSPRYPRSMMGTGFSGEVLIDFTVGEDGKVKNASIVKSNNPVFEEPCLEAVKDWRFKPGTRDGKPVSTHMQVPMVVMATDARGERHDYLEARAPSTKAVEKLPPELRFDTPPRFVDVARPVFPYELQREGIKGKATVTFVVDARGQVVSTRVDEASRPEFGMAAAAAVEAARLEPALLAGQPTNAAMRHEMRFDYDPDNVLLQRDGRLINLEKNKPERVVAANQLDAKLKAINRRAPQFPTALQKRLDHGEAVVEFLVDEEGRPKLPRVVSASEPEFGYAAVQAIGSWAFESPVSGGKPAIVRVQQPFKFTPKPAPAAKPPAKAE